MTHIWLLTTENVYNSQVKLLDKGQLTLCKELDWEVILPILICHFVTNPNLPFCYQSESAILSDKQIRQESID